MIYFLLVGVAIHFFIAGATWSAVLMDNASPRPSKPWTMFVLSLVWEFTIVATLVLEGKPPYRKKA